MILFYDLFKIDLTFWKHPTSFLDSIKGPYYNLKRYYEFSLMWSYHVSLIVGSSISLWIQGFFLFLWIQSHPSLWIQSQLCGFRTLFLYQCLSFVDLSLNLVVFYINGVSSGIRVGLHMSSWSASSFGSCVFWSKLGTYDCKIKQIKYIRKVYGVDMTPQWPETRVDLNYMSPLNLDAIEHESLSIFFQNNNCRCYNASLLFLQISLPNSGESTVSVMDNLYLIIKENLRSHNLWQVCNWIS